MCPLLCVNRSFIPTLDRTHTNPNPESKVCLNRFTFLGGWKSKKHWLESRVSVEQFALGVQLYNISRSNGALLCVYLLFFLISPSMLYNLFVFSELWAVTSCRLLQQPIRSRSVCQVTMTRQSCD